MKTKYVFIRNISGSALDLATTGLFMNKDAISKDSYELDQLNRSSEIRKFVGLKFIQLLSQDELDKVLASERVKSEVKVETPVEEDFFSTMESSQAAAKAVDMVEKGLSVLKLLLKGEKVKKGKRGKEASKATPPAGETESSEGTFTPEQTLDEQRADEADPIPDSPPPGMEPMNEPVKRLLGRPPYTKAAERSELEGFIQGTMDLGMLRELSTFLPVGELKSKAKKKLRQVQARLEKAGA